MAFSKQESQNSTTMSRREFIKTGSLLLGAAFGVTGCCILPKNRVNATKIGMLTDVHYADRDMRGNRYYRESLAKAEKCIETFNIEKPDFVIEMGDFVDKGESVAFEMSYLEKIEGVYAKFNGQRHYVLGNHDVATFSKDQFISNCGARKNYYSFDNGDFHFVVLDACYNEDESDYNAGNFSWTETYIPSKEQGWLEADLQDTDKEVVLFVHQRLDDEENPHGVKNSPAVREILERSGKVFAVFQGHDHRGAYSKLNGIHYCTLPAMVEGTGLESNAYAMVQIWSDGRISIDGYASMKDQDLSA